MSLATLKHALFVCLLALPGLASAFQLETRQVAPEVYALIGPIGGRTYENHGLNANFGFVVTPEGVALIDSGASSDGAKVIEAAVKAVTPQPIRWVINTGSQDHRWLGNGYFAGKGAQILALKRTTDTQAQFADQHLAGLASVLKERLDGTVAVTAPQPIAADRQTLNLGGMELELIWFADAHFAGDAVVWLPKQGVLFSGDHIYVDRILGVLPWSHAQTWRAAFHQLEALQPRVIVPGHGGVCDLAKAKRDTGDYLDWLVDEVGRAQKNWEPIESVVARLADAPRFSHLENFDSLHRGNVNRTYLEFESQ